MKLVPDEQKFTKNNSITFKLRVAPTQANSATYELTVPILDGSEGVRPAVIFRKVISTVFNGMNADNAAKKDGMVKRILKGNALQAYEGALRKHVLERWAQLKELAKHTSADNGEDEAAQKLAMDAVQKPDINEDGVQKGIDAVVIYMCPYKALPRIKRWLRRKCRKEVGMTIREFYTHLQRVNSDELPQLPPDFSESQSLGSDEIIDIILFAIPNSWKKELDRQGKDPDELGEVELIRLLEQYEASESYEPVPKKKTDSSKTKGASTKKAKTTSTKKDKYCEKHGWNSTHKTSECKVLKNQKTPYKNKTWKKNDADRSKQELKLLIQETLKEELNSVESDSKKRKSEDSEDTEEELDMLESYDYGDMDDIQKIKQD